MSLTENYLGSVAVILKVLHLAVSDGWCRRHTVMEYDLPCFTSLLQVQDADDQ